MKSTKFVLKKDLVIPAGTVFDTAAAKSVRHTEHVEYDLALGNDNVISVVVPVEEGEPAFDAAFVRLQA